MEYTVRQWPGLALWCPRGRDRQRVHGKIYHRGLIGEVPISRGDCAKIIRQVRASIRKIDAARV